MVSWRCSARPVTQEDHVQRALLAALAIQRALGGTEDARDADKLDLPVRIGIHTGPVVFGPIADKLPMDYTAIGDTANVAARIQQAAEPATILLSEATYELAQSYARVEPVGPLVLKGKADPITAYRLLDVSQARAALRPSTAAHRTTFVDRQSDLAILNNFLRQVENGHRQAVGIVGEPGIGKSRLLSEFRRQLASERVTWIEGRCVSYGTAIPYLLMLDLLRSNCGILETDTPESMIAKVRSGLERVGMDPDQDSPVLLHLLGVKDAGDGAGPCQSRSRQGENLRHLPPSHHQIESRTASRPRARGSALGRQNIGRVSRVPGGKYRRRRILMLATYRPGYRPPWIDKSYAGQVPVQPLSRDDSIDVVRSVLNAERIIELATEEIVAKADGNPLFLEQLTLHAGEAKDLRSGLMVPDTIHDVVMARIDRLPDELKQLLQMASVLGREFSLRLLSAVWSGAGRLESLLRELNRLEFIYERLVGDGIVYVFRHALTQEAAYGSLLERHRRVHHGAVGYALEELYRDRSDEVAELLALHFGRSDEAEKAVDYAILAAEKSQRRWANNEALTYFDDALRRLDAMPDTEPNRLRRIDAVLKQAEVKYALGQYAEHIESARRNSRHRRETDDPRRRATWHYWTGFLHSLTGGGRKSRSNIAARRRRLRRPAAWRRSTALPTSCLAQVYMVAGKLRDAVEAGERALASFEARGDRVVGRPDLWYLTWPANYLGEWEASLDYCRRGLEHGIALKDLGSKAVGWCAHGIGLYPAGDIERGLQCCDEALALAPHPARPRVGQGDPRLRTNQSRPAGCRHRGARAKSRLVRAFSHALQLTSATLLALPKAIFAEAIAPVPGP